MLVSEDMFVQEPVAETKIWPQACLVSCRAVGQAPNDDPEQSHLKPDNTSAGVGRGLELMACADFCAVCMRSDAGHGGRRLAAAEGAGQHGGRPDLAARGGRGRRPSAAVRGEDLERSCLAPNSFDFSDVGQIFDQSQDSFI